MLREAYAEFFANANFKVATAFNGYEAFNLIKINEYDLVFTDYSMPLLTGIELLEKCQNIEKKMPPFILNTGHSCLKNLGDLSKFTAVLRKGTDVVTLLATLESAIKGSQVGGGMKFIGVPV